MAVGGGLGGAGADLLSLLRERESLRSSRFQICWEARYNQTARVLGVVAILFAYTAITSYQFIGGGDILHLIFPSITARHGQEIIAAFVIVFTAIAGISSVAYMDLAIGVLATVALIVALPDPDPYRGRLVAYRGGRGCRRRILRCLATLRWHEHSSFFFRRAC